MRIVISFLLLISALCFAWGISLPIIHFKKLYFFNDTPSLVGIFTGLWSEANYFVAIALLIFSIIFPLMKLSIVFISAIAPSNGFSASPLHQWAGALSKWSMMDVLLVALVIFAAKSTGLATATAQPGLWFYATSAISGAIAAGMLKRTTHGASERNRQDPPPEDISVSKPE